MNLLRSKTGDCKVSGHDRTDTVLLIQISDALARTLKQLSSITVEAENRKSVLDQISVMEATLEETDWLAIYEDDPNKYKVSQVLCSSYLPQLK